MTAESEPDQDNGDNDALALNQAVKRVITIRQTSDSGIQRTIMVTAN